MKKYLPFTTRLPQNLIPVRVRFFSQINVTGTRSLEYYRLSFPGATKQALANFSALIKLHSQYPEVFWISDQLRPDSLVARITIVEQLSYHQQNRGSPVTPPPLEFKVIQATMQEEIQRHLQHLLNNVQQPDDTFFEEANYFMQLAQKVDSASHMGILIVSYQQLQSSKYAFKYNQQISLDVLQASGKTDYRIKTYLTLNYLFTGKIDSPTKACLLERSYHDPDFLSETSIAQAENQALFIKLKAIFENMASYLKVSDATYGSLLSNIQRSQHIIELMKALYTHDGINNWCSILDEVQRNPQIFKNPTNIERQLEYLLVNPSLPYSKPQ